MWQIFKHKEKNSIVINIVYIISLAFYVFSITTMDFGEGQFQFYPFVMLCIIVETFRHSIINMSYYFANDNELSLNQAITSRLKVHLKFLSIKMNDFVYYNVIYTILRLLPFVLLTLIFNRSITVLGFITVFSSLYLLKAFVGPMSTYINSIQINLQLHNKELNKKEKKEKFQQLILEDYPLSNIKVFNRLRVLYMISSFILFVIIYFFIFRFVFEIFNLNIYITFIIGAVAFINILIYGFYLNNLERKQDNVLYQE